MKKETIIAKLKNNMKISYEKNAYLRIGKMQIQDQEKCKFRTRKNANLGLEKANSGLGNANSGLEKL